MNWYPVSYANLLSPVSQAMDAAVKEENMVRKLHHMVFAYSQMLRTTAAVFLSEYLAGDEQDVTVNRCGKSLCKQSA